MVATQSNEIQRVPWKIFDAFLVLMFIVIGSAALLLSLFVLIENQETLYTIFSIAFSILTIFVPFFWLKKKYSIDKEMLGLRRGKYSTDIKFAIGAISAFLLFLVVIASPFWRGVAIDSDVQDANNLLSLFFVPLTIMGATKFILSPLGEEILFRGLIFGCLRERAGVLYAIIIQSIISGALHIIYIKEAFQSSNFFSLLSYLIIIQVVFCLLYEKSKSLYPSVICHGLFNYLVFVYPRF